MRTSEFTASPGGQRVRGHSVVLDGLDMVVHRTLSNNDVGTYTVSEPRSGRKVTRHHGTKLAALAEAAEVIEREGGGALVALRAASLMAEDQWPRACGAWSTTGGRMQSSREISKSAVLAAGGPLDAPSWLPMGSTRMSYGGECGCVPRREY